MEDHLTLAAVGRKLSMSPDSVRRLVEQGALKAINVGAGKKYVMLRIPVSELERFLSERAVA